MKTENMYKDIPFSTEEEMTDFLRVFRKNLKMIRGIDFKELPEYKDVKDICADCMTRIKGVSENKTTWICPNCKTKHDTDRNAARIIFFAYHANNQN